MQDLDARFLELLRPRVKRLIDFVDQGRPLLVSTVEYEDDAVAKHLTNARHVAVQATAHGVVATPCGQQLIRTFLQRGTAGDLDTSCITTVRRPPFFVTPAGPDPSARGN